MWQHLHEGGRPEGVWQRGRARQAAVRAQEQQVRRQRRHRHGAFLPAAAARLIIIGRQQLRGHHHELVRVRAHQPACVHGRKGQLPLSMSPSMLRA